ncbi:MAG: neutral/alkaline non-lysosomal ceramidase N-terminal domain-containing protein [Clostridiales bacterium]|nr:neutral/alkaline non-lysosomal ceramidase N-terminal domain-containing protein [Clostridiales bacterium]
MRAGYGKADITPAYATMLAGFDARKQRSEGVMDPLEVRALALESGKSRLLWLAFDLLGVDMHLCRKIGERLSGRLGIPSNCIVLSSTHTHAAPRDARQEGSTYTETLAQAAETATEKALKNLEDAIIMTGEGKAEGIASYRDKTRETSMYDMPVRVLRFVCGGKEISGIELIACHPTVLNETNLLVSADLPGRSRGNVSLMLNGACADLSTRYTREGKGESELERLGTKLKKAVGCVGLHEIPAESAVLKRRIRLPQRRDFTAAERETLKEGFAKRLSQLTDEAAKREIESCLLVLDRPPKELAAEREVEIGLVKLGDVLLLTLPFEMGSTDGEAMEKLITDATGLRAWAVCYTGGYEGYLPSGRPLTVESGYQDIASPYPPQAVEILKQNAIEMAKELINGNTVS